MRIIAFYSFKGGVGRTTSLLNVAYCLAERGRKVVVADWDLHAPGLSLMELMHAEADAPPTAGVLDWLVDLKPLSKDQVANRTSIADIVVCPRLVKDAQREERQVDDPEQPRMRGELLFLPAGDLSQGAERFAERVKEAGLHDLQRFLRDVDPDDKRFVFKVFCEELRETRLPWTQPASQGEPDYLLVDCRTGLTEVGDLLLGEATDFNVLVYAHDPQNLKGLEIALNVRPRMPWQLQNNTLLLWTLEPIGQEVLKLDVRRRKRELIQAVCQRDSLGMQEAFPDEYDIPYHPELALTNEPIVHRYFSSELAQVFRKATDRLEEKTHWRDTVIREMRSDWRQAGQTPGPPNVAAKLETVLGKPEENERIYRRALAELALAREFTPLLFNPPTFDFAGCSLDDVSDEWPEDLSEDDRHLLANLCAWSISLETKFKLDTVRSQLAKLSPTARQELMRALQQERRQFLTLTGLYVWSIASLAMTAAWEWWLFAGSEESRKTAATQIVRPLLDGQPVERLPVSQSPWFPLLTALVIGKALKPSKQDAGEGTDYPRLREWLKTCGIDLPRAMLRLTKQACARGQRSEAYATIAPYAWFEVGQALSQEALRRKPDEGRVHWFDHAVEALDKAVSLRTDDPVALFNLGFAVDERGRATEGDQAKREWFDRAIAACEQSLARRPDDVATLDNLTASLLRCWWVTEDREERAELLAAAERRNSQARALDPEKALYNYCCVLSLQGRHEPALAELKALLEKRPEHKKDVAEDPDFEPLSGLVEFQRLIEPYPWQPDPSR
jgi:hypothetical protein